MYRYCIIISFQTLCPICCTRNTFIHCIQYSCCCNEFIALRNIRVCMILYQVSNIALTQCLRWDGIYLFWRINESLVQLLLDAVVRHCAYGAWNAGHALLVGRQGNSAIAWKQQLKVQFRVVWSARIFATWVRTTSNSKNDTREFETKCLTIAISK